jgi:hypothetical protein
MLPPVLHELETPRAPGLAVLAEHTREVMLCTNSHVPRLAAASADGSHQRLQRGIREAAPALRRPLRSGRTRSGECHLSTQGNLYQVQPQVLVEKDATKLGVVRAGSCARTWLRIPGADLAVIHFSGHGAMVDGKLYLPPQDVNAFDAGRHPLTSRR